LGLALEEVVVGAALDRLERGGLVVTRGEDDDRHAGGGGHRALYGVEALAVGKREIEEQRVERFASKRLLGGQKRRDPAEPDGAAARELVVDERRVGVVVFDKEHSERSARGRQPTSHCG